MPPISLLDRWSLDLSRARLARGSQLVRLSNLTGVWERFCLCFLFSPPSLSLLRHLKHPKTGVCLTVDIMIIISLFFRTCVCKITRLGICSRPRQCPSSERTILTCSYTEQSSKHFFTGRRGMLPRDRQVSANSSSAVARFLYLLVDEIHQVLRILLLPLPAMTKKRKKDVLQIGWNTTYRSTLFSSWLSGNVRVTLPCETSF